VGDGDGGRQRGDGGGAWGSREDRDIVVELVAREVDTTEVTVGEAMSNELLTVNEKEQLTDLVQQMQGKAVRRVPVVDANGALVGIVTVDDVIDLIAEQLTSLVGLVQREQNCERSSRVVE